MKPAQPNQSLMHGLTVLQTVMAEPRPLGSRELARRAGMEHTRVSRLLGTLAHLGVVRRTPEGKYAPGPGLHVLAAQALAGSGLLASALPHLKALRDAQTTVALGVLWQQQVCYLLHVRPGRGMEEGIGQHHLLPAERSSLGLALLAHHDYATSRAEPWTLIRNQRFARIDFPGGEVSLATPIFADESRPEAAIGLSRPGIKAAEARALVDHLRETAATIAADLRQHDLGQDLIS